MFGLTSNLFTFKLISKQVRFLTLNAIVLSFFCGMYIILYLLNKDDHYTYDKTYNLQSPFDMLYFATITQYTIGYGDIAPRSILCKSTVIVHMIVTFIIFGLLSFE